MARTLIFTRMSLAAPNEIYIAKNGPDKILVSQCVV